MRKFKTGTKDIKDNGAIKRTEKTKIQFEKGEHVLIDNVEAVYDMTRCIPLSETMVLPFFLFNKLDGKPYSMTRDNYLEEIV